MLKSSNKVFAYSLPGVFHMALGFYGLLRLPKVAPALSRSCIVAVPPPRCSVLLCPWPVQLEPHIGSDALSDHPLH